MRTRQAFPIQADNREGTSSVNSQINNYENEGNNFEEACVISEKGPEEEESEEEENPTKEEKKEDNWNGI